MVNKEMSHDNRNVTTEIVEIEATTLEKLVYSSFKLYILATKILEIALSVKKRPNRIIFSKTYYWLEALRSR
jgi:hypothetical protein